MTVLSDRQIRERIERERIVEPFDERNLTPNGIDLRVDEIMFEGIPVEGEVFVIPPGGRVLLSTLEVITVPHDLVGNLWLRSSWIRRGLISAFGVVDAGFSGALTMAAFNAGHEGVRIARGDRFVQIVFHAMDERAEVAYARRSGNYQNQRGITLPSDG